MDGVLGPVMARLQSGVLEQVEAFVVLQSLRRKHSLSLLVNVMNMK